MRWIMGVDTRPSSEGALHFGRWLASHSDPPHDLIPVHVLEEAYLHVVLRYHSLDEVMQGATATVRASLRDVSLHTLEPMVMPGASAEAVLAQLVQDHRATGLIIGRQAATGTRPIIRLGRVARRLVRHLASPTLVVPPDLLPDQIGQGPVILATDLRDDAAPAASFARDLSAQLGRELLVAHVVPMAEDFGAHYIPADTLQKLRQTQSDEGQQALDAWLTEQNLTGVRRRLLQGSIVENLNELVQLEQAPILVTGCRRLNLVERIAQASIATELACVSRCAIATVPP